MGIWSWLFPSVDERITRVRALMAAGKFEKARKELVHIHHPDAEKLYDQCSAAVDKEEAGHLKKAAAAEGFHGWKVKITGTSDKRRRELEGLIAKEMEQAGVDLGLPQLDEDAVKAAITRAQRRARPGSARDAQAMIKLVPMMDRPPAR